VTWAYGALISAPSTQATFFAAFSRSSNDNDGNSDRNNK